MARPYTILSSAMSLDGYLDDASDQRLILSNEADLDRVDALRADADAILVGAATVRKDNPQLMVRSPDRRRRRIAAGLPESPTKVTVSASGNLPDDLRFFTRGDGDKIVYGPDVVSMGYIGEDLYRRGVRRLLVEGGGTVHTQFLADGLADELQLTVAPFFVGDSQARRFVDDARFPWRADRRARLLETRPVGDVVLLRYALSDRCPAEAGA